MVSTSAFCLVFIKASVLSLDPVIQVISFVLLKNHIKLKRLFYLANCFKLSWNYPHLMNYSCLQNMHKEHD